jgi:hypothetical protein
MTYIDVEDPNTLSYSENDRDSWWLWVFHIYFRLGPGLAGERYAHWTDGEGKGGIISKKGHMSGL